jgi:hypothetical protein
MDVTDEWPIWSTSVPSADNRYNRYQIYFRESIMPLTPVKDKQFSPTSSAIRNCPGTP